MFMFRVHFKDEEGGEGEFYEDCSLWDIARFSHVAAESEEAARIIHPSECDEYSTWARKEDIEHVKVTLIGTTHLEAGVILASFNAG